MNIWIATGRVGRDAELRTTQSGENVLSFTLANDVGFGDRKLTQWADCSIWGKRATALQNYIKKGDKVTVSGELRLEEFSRRDGSTGSKLSVRVSEIELGGAPKEGGASRDYDAPLDGRRDQGGPRRSAPSQGGHGRGQPGYGGDLDDSIPF